MNNQNYQYNCNTAPHYYTYGPKTQRSAAPNTQTYINPNAQTYAAPNAQYQTAPQAQTQPYSAPKANRVKVPGRAGAIARLIVMSVMIVLGMVGVLASAVNSQPSFGELVLGGIWGTGTMLILGAWIWSVMKWIGFIAPKSLQWAKSFWRAWHPFTFFGLYIKVMLFVIILIAPSSASMSTYSVFYLLAFKSVENMSFPVAFATLLLGIALVAVMVFWDICKIRGWAFKPAAMELFRKLKQVCTRKR